MQTMSWDVNFNVIIYITIIYNFMKKILFFAVMFCVALSTSVLVSCGDDDDSGSSGKGVVFNSKIYVSDELLNIYQNIKVTYTFADGIKVTEDVKSIPITYQRELKERGDVEVSFSGTLREEAVEDNKMYDMSVQYVGTIGGMAKSETFGGSKAGSVLKEKYKDLSSNSAFKSHIYRFTQTN